MSSAAPSRPVDAPNAWVADPADAQPELHLDWESPVNLGRVKIEFDPDWDHPMESVLMTHPEEVVPFMVKDFDLLDDAGKVFHSIRDHHGAIHEWCADGPFLTSRLTLRILATHGGYPRPCSGLGFRKVKFPAGLGKALDRYFA